MQVQTRVGDVQTVGEYELSVYRTDTDKYIAFARFKPNPVASVWTDEFDTIEEADAMVYEWTNTINNAQEEN